MTSTSIEDLQILPGEDEFLNRIIRRLSRRGFLTTAGVTTLAAMGAGARV